MHDCIPLPESDKIPSNVSYNIWVEYADVVDTNHLIILYEAGKIPSNVMLHVSGRYTEQQQLLLLESTPPENELNDKLIFLFCT